MTETPAEFELIEADNGALALTGVIWATGEHNLRIGGTPKTAAVDTESLQSTYEGLNADLEAGAEIPIGFDHPQPDSVAATTDLGTVGYVEAVELSADESEIVMTDSRITNETAKDALRAGEFDALDFSIVGGYEAAKNPKNTDVVPLTAEITGVDLVIEGAVASANVGSMPPLAAAAAEEPGDLDASAEFVEALQDHDSDAVEAADVIAAKDAEIERLRGVVDSELEEFEAEMEEYVGDEVAKAEAKAKAEIEAVQERAEAFEAAAEAAGLEAGADPHALVDAQTLDLREEIAELEADLPSEETEDVDARVAALAGTSADDLEARLSDLALDHSRSNRRRNTQSNAIIAGSSDDHGIVDGSGSMDQADNIAAATLDPVEKKDASTRGLSAAAYVREEYDIDARDHDTDQSLLAAMSERRRERREEADQ